MCPDLRDDQALANVDELQVVDANGTVRKDARVKFHWRRIPFDFETKTFESLFKDFLGTFQVRGNAILFK